MPKSVYKTLNVQYILLCSLILCIALKIKLRLNIRYTIFTFLLISICLLLPIYNMVAHLYYQVQIICMVFGIILTILLSPLQNVQKSILIILLLYLYNKNIRLVYNIVSTYKSVKSVSANKQDYLIKSVTNIYTNCGFKIIHNFNNLPNYSSILIANYVHDRVENPLCALIPKKLAILMQDGFEKFELEKIISKPIYVKGHNKGNYEYIEKQIQIAINEGNSIFVYANAPSYFNYIGVFSSGIFKIAKNKNIPITPIAIDTIKTKFGIIFNQNINIKVGETFYVNNVSSAQYRVRNFLRLSLKEFDKNKFMIQF